MIVTSLLFLLFGVIFTVYGYKVTKSYEVVVLYKIKQRLTNRDITDIRAYNNAYGKLYIVNGIILLAFGVMFLYVNDMILLSKVSLILPLIALDIVIINWFISYKYSIKRKRSRNQINWH